MAGTAKADDPAALSAGKLQNALKNGDLTTQLKNLNDAAGVLQDPSHFEGDYADTFRPSLQKLQQVSSQLQQLLTDSNITRVPITVKNIHQAAGDTRQASEA